MTWSWTLILLLSGVNGAPAPVAVPGYSSETACREVGKEAVEAGRARNPYVLNFICIRVR